MTLSRNTTSKGVCVYPQYSHMMRVKHPAYFYPVYSSQKVGNKIDIYINKFLFYAPVGAAICPRWGDLLINKFLFYVPFGAAICPRWGKPSYK